MALLSQIITVGLLATLAMTVFSYVLAYFTNSKFEEPQLLNILIDRLPFIKSKISREHILGWSVHLCTGFFFIFLYLILQDHFNFETSILSGILLGIIGGLGGVFIWHFTFLLHPNPPSLKRVPFYAQLVIAHVIFGVCAILLLKLF
ncbi:hypothetical protein [Aequorivita lipolytica]|uniref:DUF2938 domain-containing protein n=1 Tax=Aequorivita lipolytica TaxID=153267 RepID=A0A5C6YLN4_9FLAO|nr:hypothetical protein [Aequorivita lipolytica]TXD68289.1 hypothetical protein ESV24_12545 [Aequorivita lipolytica]SRX53441.1 hypothetical protein AEQU2_02672 [Aequorivita lipolytica]